MGLHGGFKLKPDCLEKFQNAGERFLIDISELQDAGKKVAGTYCLFAPVEIVRAAGAIPVSLCGLDGLIRENRPRRSHSGS
jgi:benzoyl-CoA reductase/2-hydroxyglutaryl-CoA dehydratase subunit BcrC/BadD/HgdB